jgi:predicted amidohydrolase YtcJ
MRLLRCCALLLMTLTLIACQSSEPEEATSAAEPAAAGTPAAPSVEIADHVLTGGTVITVDEDQSEAEAIALKDGRILAVGSADAIAAHIGDSTEVVELNGRVVVPGFIEGHGHFLGLGQSLMTLDLMPTRSFGEIVDMVAEAAAKAAPGDWIIGRGWHQERWGESDQPLYEGLPHHRALSAVSPDNPVVLFHASGHAAYANAAALARAGIDADTPDPEGGKIVRDDNGEATGFLRQMAQRPIHEQLAAADDALSDEQRQARFERQVELAGEEALRHGITSFHDMGTNFADIDRLKALAEAGRLPVRLHVAVRHETNQTLRERLADYRMIDHADGFLTVRALKRNIDGALGTHGAWLLDPYADKPDTSGLPQTTLEDLRETAEIALEFGFQLNTHAIGDRGNREVLDMYEDLLSQRAGEDLRWRVEHAQTLHPDEVPRFAALGAIASMQGVHATSDGPWVPQRLGEARARERAYVWRALLDAGAVICNGTDVPVESISPIASYASSVTRRMANGEQFFPEQSMTRMEALQSYTLGCAQAVFDEDQLGSLTPGKRADLVVLDANPLTVPESELTELQVEMTWVDGKLRYRREG